MEKFSTYFSIKMAYLAFSASEQLSSTLQRKNTTVQESFIATNLTKSFYDRQRDPSAFLAFYKQAASDAEGKTDPPTLPRYRKAPRHADDLSSGQTHRYDSPCDFYREQYFQTMESLSGELTRRFEQKGFRLVSQIESLLLDSSNCNFQEIPAEIVDMYARDVDMDRLKMQQPMIPDFIKSRNPDGITIKEVTSICTLCEVFNSVPVAKTMLSEVHAMLCLYFTIPVTSATAERTFSVLKRLKTYLRSMMTQERLNNVMMMHIYKELTDQLNFEDTAQMFSLENGKRRQYFGSFK